MPEETGALVVLSTVPDADKGREIARALVDARLAACVNAARSASGIEAVRIARSSAAPRSARFAGRRRVIGGSPDAIRTLSASIRTLSTADADRS